MRLTLLSAISVASVALAAPDLSHRFHHRAVVERQRPNMNNSWSEPPISSSTAVISSASSSPTARPSSSVSTSSAERSSESTAPPPSSSTSTTAQASSAPPPASSAQTSAAQPQSSAVPQQSGQAGDEVRPESGVPTISVPSSSAAPTTAVAPVVISTASSTLRSSLTSVTTATRTQSSTSSASAEAATTEEKSSGLSKPALIGIIVAASVVGAAAIAFTLFRKWKLRPSNRFEKRLNAIDFTPKGGYEDDYFEKSHNRSASASSAERHRKALMAEEFESGTNHVPGVPEHDFTAVSTYGMAGAGAGMGAHDMYNSDPFAHAQAYEYGYPPQTYDQYGNPVALAPVAGAGAGAAAYDYPTQDQDYAHAQAQAQQGYADLQRGGSTGSQHQHQHQTRSGSPTGPHQPQVYPNDFPEPGQYLGRPTGGADGPYAQAAQYRGY